LIKVDRKSISVIELKRIITIESMKLCIPPILPIVSNQSTLVIRVKSS